MTGESYITEAQARAIAEAAGREAAKETVKDMLLAMGMDVEDADGVIAAQGDMAWLRRQRRASEQIAVWARRTVVGVVLTGVGGVIWLGLQQAFGKG